MARKSFSPELIIAVLIGVGLLIYIIIRAIVIPITIDEANTCLTFSVTSVWDIMTYKDPIPNNHILNTLLVKLFTNVFGMKQFVARLPNILGFILYYSVIVVWIRKINSNILFLMTGIVLFTCNPFLIDFFSLARGYALSIDFMILSAYFAWRFITEQKIKFHLWSVCWAAVAVYTNFTILNYYVALCALFFILAVRHYKTGRKTFYSVSKQITMVTIILSALSFYPIYRMMSTNQFQFWGNTGFYSDTVYTLAQASAYGLDYFHFTPHVWANVFIYLFAIISLFAIRVVNKYDQNDSVRSFLFFAFILAGGVLVNVIQYYVAGVPWLTTRTALFYFPLLILGLLFLINYLRIEWKQGFVIISVVFICTGIIHLSRSLNLTSCYEWKFDANNMEVIKTIDSLSKTKGGNVSLDVFWIHYPSMNFITTTTKYKSVEVIPFHFDVNPNSTADYYYIQRSEFQPLENNYEILRTYNYGEQILAVKKSADELQK